MAVLEAAALGVPTVASSVGGIPEIVEDGVTGVLVKPGDADALAVALRKLAGSPHPATLLGHAAWGRVRRRHRPDDQLDALLTAYARAGATSNSATSSHRVSFHQFQQGTGQRIRHKRVAEDSGDEVDYGDIVKGYEIDKGRYLIVTKEELEAIEPAAAERSRSKTSSTWRTSIPSLGTRPTTLGLRRTSERRGPTRY